MTQAEKATPVADSTSNAPQKIPLTAEQASNREAITATATAVVAEVITTAHGEAGRNEIKTSTQKEATTVSAPATSEVRGEASTAPDNKAEVSGVATDAQLGASSRPIRPGGDLRASFLAAVGNTIPQTVRTRW